MQTISAVSSRPSLSSHNVYRTRFHNTRDAPVHASKQSPHQHQPLRINRLTMCGETDAAQLTGGHDVSRRAFGAALSTLLLSSPPAFAEELYAAIPGERFAPLDVTFEMPAAWKARPGQKPKDSKFLLYTDTYGPNYRYNRVWPRLKDEEGYAVDSIELVVSGSSGTERITDFGPQKNVDVGRAFGFAREDLPLAEILSAGTRTDESGQAYYEWELETSNKTHILVTAAASGGGLYVLCVGLTEDQWAKGGTEAKKILATFVVPCSEESRNDISSRIYGNVKAGGFS